MKEVDGLRVTIRAEAGHCQFVRQLLCIGLLLALILMNLMMGSSTMDSIVGIQKCSPMYWIIQVIFLIFCGIFTFIAVRIARRDQTLKLKYGSINVADCDIRYDDNRRLSILLFIGFISGWVAGALGLGGGCVYNPALLAMGIPPKVSSATGLYLVTFSKIASVFVYFLNGQLDI